MRHILLSVTTFVTCLSLRAQTPITSITNFGDCLHGTLPGYTTTCPLAAGNYPVSTPLTITVSNLTIKGTGAAASDTTLKRASSSVPNIMVLQECGAPGCSPTSPTQHHD
jgi:hypothetical protein